MPHQTRPMIGIVITPAAEVLSRPRADAGVLRTLTEGYLLSVISRGPKWIAFEDAEGAGHLDAGCVELADPEARGFLAGDTSLLSAAVECEGSERLASAGGTHEASVARAWNLYGRLLGSLSRRLRIDPAYAVAVLCVESAGQGYGPDGRVIIRFENHIYRRYLVNARGAEGQAVFDRHFRITGEQPWMGHSFRTGPRAAWSAFHGSQELEWQAYELACSFDEDAATRSISMGLPQVMGFNHGLLGYATPRALLAFMAADVRFQLMGLFDFVGGADGDGRGVQALRRGDFDGFATVYNGPGQARYYGELIAAHVQAFRRLRPAPISDTATTNTSVTEKLGRGAQPARKPASKSSDKTSTSPDGRSYEVRPGDTLSAIAGRFGVTVRELAEANGIANPDRIAVGLRLHVPAAEPPPPAVVVPSAPPEELTETTTEPRHAYIVQPGDTLGAIAYRAGTTVAKLASENGITNVDRIFPGQVIYTPKAFSG